MNSCHDRAGQAVPGQNGSQIKSLPPARRFIVHRFMNIHGSCNYHTFSRQWLKSIFLTDFGLAGCKVGKAVVISIRKELEEGVRIQNSVVSSQNSVVRMDGRRR